MSCMQKQGVRLEAFLLGVGLPYGSRRGAGGREAVGCLRIKVPEDSGNGS